jgi:protein-S-isoprenylcysteine O-methyltransferase Ste14
MNETIDKNEKLKNDPKVIHLLLAHSYTIHLLNIGLSVVLGLIFTDFRFSNQALSWVGLVLIMVGTFFVYWAQKTSSSTRAKMMKGEVRNFASGPYKYNRNPTHFGLVLSTFGLGLVSGSYFILITTFVTLILSKTFFLPKEEKILELKYGQHYSDYKKKVRNWF